MENRIDQTFAQCRAENRKALVMYVCAGDPSLEVTEELILRIAAAGADIIEVGVPFSDPMADGVAIQEAGQRALAAGTTLAGIMDMVRRLRAKIDTPMVLFSYYNVLFNYGVEKLAEESVQGGIDGWLVVDVPFEEQAEIKPTLTANNLHLITLLAPTTPVERAREILEEASGFVYYITVTGVTGARSELPKELSAQLATVKELTEIPVVAGFGISSPEMAKTVAAHADGVVVGSALVKTLAAKPEAPAEALQGCAEFVAALSAVL